MKTQDIDFQLFPDVTFQGNVYSNYDESKRLMSANRDIPFLRAHRDAQDCPKLLLVGDGSIGKTTSLRVFEAEMLYRNKPCLFYECKNINDTDVKEIDSVAQQYRNGYLIFDAYDELPSSVKTAFDGLLERLNQYEIPIIISCRYDPRQEYASVTAGEIFGSYQPVYIRDFSDRQLDSLVSKQISRSSGYYKLLNNTMFLSLHRELEQNGLLDTLKESIKTEAEFIQQYFELLYLDKLDDEVMFSDLIHLGRYIHNQRMAEAVDRKGSKKRKIRTNRYPVRIPSPLKHIFSYGKPEEGKEENKDKLGAKQLKYLNYLHGLYLKEELLYLLDVDSDDELIRSAAELLDIPSTAEISESIYYTGQLLANSPEAVRLLIALNDFDSKRHTRYENVLCLFIGYNHDVAEDIPGVFEFYHPVMNDNRGYIHVCDRICALKANSVKDLHFGRSGFPRLEVIDINNDVYYSKGNSLIKRGHAFAGLYLGCANSEIPSEVRFIATFAFSHSNIKSIVLPPNVRDIDRLAFVCCEQLERVELGAEIKKVSENAFYQCTAVKTLRIGNNCLQIGDNAYHRGAFSPAPSLEQASVPTTFVEYIYSISAETLSSLEVFQGYDGSVPRKLSLNCIQAPSWWGSLRKLTVGKDVEEIVHDSFNHLVNELESITVEPGCKKYYSVDNCLISAEDQLLILGCKNSRIPNGVRKLKSSSFSRCAGLYEIEIPESVTEIGSNCFRLCTNLQIVILKCKKLNIKARTFVSCKNIKTIVCIDEASWSNYTFEKSANNNPVLRGCKLVFINEPNGRSAFPRPASAETEMSST